MERRDNQNESTIITTASVCDVADASRRVARASRMTEHPYGQGECVSTQASRQLRPLPALRGARWRQRTGGPALQGPSRHPPSLTRRPTSRNSVLLLASTQAWPQVSRTFTVVCFCFYCRLDPLPRDHWLFTTSNAQVSDRSLSWREVLYYHAFRQRAQGKPLKAWRQRVHEKQQDGVIFGPLP